MHRMPKTVKIVLEVDIEKFGTFCPDHRNVCDLKTSVSLADYPLADIMSMTAEALTGGNDLIRLSKVVEVQRGEASHRIT